MPSSGCEPAATCNSHAMDYTKIITIEPGKRGGRPCIRGLRITVYDVAGWFASGMSESEIIEDFPDLTAEDVRAAMAYLADRGRHLVVSASAAVEA